MRKRKINYVISAAMLVSLSGFSHAASQATLHVAVYSSDFIVDTDRQVALTPQQKRVDVTIQAHGTAQGELPVSEIDIYRLDLGKWWRLEPKLQTYQSFPFLDSDTSPSAITSVQAAALRVTKIVPVVNGPLGFQTINGFPALAYTIRLTVDFTDPSTGKVLANETLLEKLWVTDKAPAVEKFRKNEKDFNDALFALHGTENADLRWLLSEFNRHILSASGNTADFVKIQTAYRTARARVPGVTVRQLGAWAWRPKSDDPKVLPGGMSPAEISAFIASVAAGLGAPPDAGNSTLNPADRPRWVTDLEKDLGRDGPTVMMLNEVIRTNDSTPNPSVFEVPNSYRLVKVQ